MTAAQERPSTTVVIGAASGMGRAVATLFAGTGRLVLADLDVDRVAAVAAELPADGPAIEATACDVTDAKAVTRLAALVGPFRNLIVSAGLSPSMAPAARIYDVNLVGSAQVLQAFEPLAGAGSAAVCFASTAGHMADFPEYAAALDDPLADGLTERLRAVGGDLVDDPAMAYVLSKRGVLRLVRRSAAAWGRRGARVVSLSPGIIDTPMGVREGAAVPAMAEMVAATPLPRQGRPEEVARVVRFLCSDEASYVSGCDLLVDGGYIGSVIP